MNVFNENCHCVSVHFTFLTETARSLVRLLFEYFTSAVNKHRSDLHAWWRIEQSQEAEFEIRVPSAFLCSQSPLLAPGVFPNYSIKTCAQHQGRILRACKAGSTTFRRRRLGAADYAPGLLGAWTFRRRDF